MRTERRIVGISLLAVLLIALLGCEGKVSKYENAKSEAEKRLAHLERILRLVKGMERSNLPVFPDDLDSLKALAQKADIEEIRKLSDGVVRTMRRVFELVPEGYEDDYEQWTQEMKQRLESVH